MEQKELGSRWDLLYGQNRKKPVFQLAREFIREAVSKANEDNPTDTDILVLDTCNNIVINLVNKNEINYNECNNLVNDIYDRGIYKHLFRPSQNSTNQLKDALINNKHQIALNSLNNKLKSYYGEKIMSEDKLINKHFNSVLQPPKMPDFNKFVAACANGEVNNVREYLKNASIRDKINTQDTNGDLALVLACVNGRDDVVSLLIENEANINAEDRTKRTAVTEMGHYNKVKNIIEPILGQLQQKNIV